MAKWIMDSAHSEIGFKVKHLMISTVKGRFATFTSELTTSNEDFNGGVVQFSADVASIETGNQQRDGHLKSADFFDAETFPKIHFSSSNISLVGNELTVRGILEIRGVQKEVVLSGEYGGMLVDPYGDVKVGFSLHTALNRKEFGLMWDGITETGGIVVADTVRVDVDVQFKKLQEIELESLT